MLAELKQVIADIRALREDVETLKAVIAAIRAVLNDHAK